SRSAGSSPPRTARDARIASSIPPRIWRPAFASPSATRSRNATGTYCSSSSGGSQKWVSQSTTIVFTGAVTISDPPVLRLGTIYTGHEDRSGPWVPVGAGVHKGTAFVGAVGTTDVGDFTVL